MSNSEIRNASRLRMIELLGGAQDSDLNLEVKVAIMQAEILDDYLEETLRSNKVVEGLLKDIRAEIEQSAATARDLDQDQAGPGQQPAGPGQQRIATENNKPHKCSICDSADYQICGCEAKAMIIGRHAKRLPDGLTRQQIIANAKIFVDWIKADLSKALSCKVSEVPAKLADWIENRQSETAAAEEK